MSKKATAPGAEAGAAAPAATTDNSAATTNVHTSAQPAHPPMVDYPPDEYTGLGGEYVRDPVTGIRTRATPA